MPNWFARHVVPLLTVLIFIGTPPGDRLLAQCGYGQYCHFPSPGECLSEICNFDQGYYYSQYIPGCGWCDLVYCEFIEVCFAGGGCKVVS
jgi:hypothetical protein